MTVAPTFLTFDSPFSVVVGQQNWLFLLVTCGYDCHFVHLWLSAGRWPEKKGSAIERGTQSTFYTFAFEEKIAEELGAKMQSWKLDPRTQ